GERAFTERRDAHAEARGNAIAGVSLRSFQFVGIVTKAGDDLQPLVGQLILDISAPDGALAGRIEKIRAAGGGGGGEIVINPVAADGQLVTKQPGFEIRSVPRVKTGGGEIIFRCGT